MSTMVVYQGQFQQQYPLVVPSQNVQKEADVLKQQFLGALPEVQISPEYISGCDDTSVATPHK